MILANNYFVTIDCKCKLMQHRPKQLSFTEYLKKLPPAWVIEHFLHEDASSRKILSSAVIEEATVEFSKTPVLEDRFLNLDKENQLRCALMFLMGSLGISCDSGLGLRDPIALSFLGYPAKDERGSIRIFPFEKFEPALRPLLAKVIAAEKKAYAQRPQSIFRHRPCNDITVIAALAAQHQLVKKKNGKLGVAPLQLVKKLTHASSFYKPDDIEMLTEVLIDFGISRKLLVNEEQEIALYHSGFSDWLTSPIEERIADIEGYFLELRREWNTALLKASASEAGNDWLPLSLFGENDLDPARESLVKLHFCRMVELQRDGSDLVFQCTPSGDTAAPPQQPPVIMPDFSVILPQETTPGTLHEFARFCTMSSLDKVYHMHIGRDVLTEALCNGIDGLHIIESLEKWRAPANVTETVREWIREFHRLSLATGSILITSEENITDQIASCQPLSECIERIHVHSIFRIKPGCENTVREIVRKLGFDDRMPKPPAAVYTMENIDTLLKPPQISWTPVLDDYQTQKPAAPSIRGTKYGAELKPLDLSEMVQVIDYAILTGQKIAISYEGSPYVRKAIYTVTPSLCSKGVEPLLEGTIQPSGVRKQFYVKKISSIGVVPQ